MDENVQPEGLDNNATRAQVDNALRAISQKKPVPEIDFTLHTMEDGTQVSTMERVCKGMSDLKPPRGLSNDSSKC